MNEFWFCYKWYHIFFMVFGLFHLAWHPYIYDVLFDVRISFYRRMNPIPLHVNTTVSLPFVCSGQWVCFHISTIVNNAAVNTDRGQRLPQAAEFISFRKIPNGRVEEKQYSFPYGCLHSHKRCVGLPFTHSIFYVKKIWHFMRNHHFHRYLFICVFWGKSPKT